jgi:hypothetical protein
MLRPSRGFHLLPLESLFRNRESRFDVILSVSEESRIHFRF